MALFAPVRRVRSKTMTRKHFEAIAATIKALDLTDSERSHVAESFADMLAAFNHLFDRQRFIRACLGA